MERFRLQPSSQETAPLWLSVAEVRTKLEDSTPLTLDDERIPVVDVNDPEYETDKGIWVVRIHDATSPYAPNGASSHTEYGFLFKPALNETVSDSVIFRTVYPDGTAHDTLMDPGDLGLRPYAWSEAQILKSPNRVFLAPTETAPH